MKVAIIGAGPCGLTALKTLRGAGLDARAFEAGNRVGGQWVIDNPSGHSAAYRSLRTNTNRAMSRFSDFAFPDDYPEYPGHAQMADWFEQYARHFDLTDRIELDASVESVVPDAGGGFLVSVKGRAPERFDAVVAATGNLWDPVVPRLPGHFDGPTIHSRDYRDRVTPIDLKNKRVLVVGLGNSGCEIAVELSRQAEVSLSARSGNFVFPRLKPDQRPPPHPVDDVGWLFRVLPERVRDALFRKFFTRALARIAGAGPAPESLGLPPLPPDPFQKRAVVNDEILGLLATGKLTARPGIRSLDGREVEFDDGSRAAFDAIVWATGYRFSLPYLARDVLGVDDPAELRLYQGILHPRHPRLFVVGVMRVFCSIWPLAEQQALWIAARLQDRFALPSASELERRAYAIQRGPLKHCPFRAQDLRREVGMR